MIVVDEPNVRPVFSTALKSNAYVLATVADGETALSRLKNDSADLALPDLTMPGMGGLELLPRLRESGDNDPVISIRAQNDAPNVVP